MNTLTEIETAHQEIVIFHLNTHPVKSPALGMTGHSVKEAAIAQGVDIKIDYALFEEIGHERTRPIEDDEHVTLTDQTRFLADVETITVQVNYKKVVVEGRRQTGSEIKAAAIAQHVNIKPDFILYEIIGPGQTKQIRDDETVKVDDCSKFDAVPDDDHS